VQDESHISPFPKSQILTTNEISDHGVFTVSHIHQSQRENQDDGTWTDPSLLLQRTRLGPGRACILVLGNNEKYFTTLWLLGVCGLFVRVDLR
jgi:hypothetical protein